jgi:hypothetical protein
VKTVVEKFERPKVIKKVRKKKNTGEILQTKLTYAQIFLKLEKRSWVLVHKKSDQLPLFYEPESGKLYDVPPGYLDYDREHFRKYI